MRSTLLIAALCCAISPASAKGSSQPGEASPGFVAGVTPTPED